ncbi:UNVERIFIED_CONTAM: hypothetical protein K2H54_011289 [Gekko kuhli]
MYILSFPETNVFRVLARHFVFWRVDSGMNPLHARGTGRRFPSWRHGGGGHGAPFSLSLSVWPAFSDSELLEGLLDIVCPRPEASLEHLPTPPGVFLNPLLSVVL